MPRDVVDFFDGPSAIGNTSIPQYQTRWACWVSNTGIRVAIYEDGAVLSDELGIPDDLFDEGTRPTKLSASFEQDALLCIAIQSGENEIEVRRKVMGEVENYLFNGLSPCLVYTGLVVYDISLVDVFCFYLKEAGDKIFVRAQRDNFGVEYELNDSFAGGLTLRAMRKAEMAKINGARYMTLRAESSDGKPVYFNTDAYDPFPEYVFDRMTLDVSAEGGAEVSSVIPLGDSDKMTLDLSAESGAEIPALVTLSAPSDKMLLDITAEAGLYLSSVVTQSAPSDKMTLDVSAESGVYTLVGVPSNAPSDKMTLDIGANDGTYP